MGCLSRVGDRHDEAGAPPGDGRRAGAGSARGQDVATSHPPGSVPYAVSTTYDTTTGEIRFHPGLDRKARHLTVLPTGIRHRAIIEAIAARDEQGAVNAIREHLSRTVAKVEDLRKEFPHYFV